MIFECASILVFMLWIILYYLISVSSPFVYVCLSLCVLLCNDHLRLVWPESNPDDDAPFWAGIDPYLLSW